MHGSTGMHVPQHLRPAPPPRVMQDAVSLMDLLQLSDPSAPEALELRDAVEFLDALGMSTDEPSAEHHEPTS